MHIVEIIVALVAAFALGWMARPYSSWRRSQIRRYGR